MSSQAHLRPPEPTVCPQMGGGRVRQVAGCTVAPGAARLNLWLPAWETDPNPWLLTSLGLQLSPSLARASGRPSASGAKGLEESQGCVVLPNSPPRRRGPTALLHRARWAERGGVGSSPGQQPPGPCSPTLSLQVWGPCGACTLAHSGSLPRAGAPRGLGTAGISHFTQGRGQGSLSLGTEECDNTWLERVSVDVPKLRSLRLSWTICLGPSCSHMYC